MNRRFPFHALTALAAGCFLTSCGDSTAEEFTSAEMEKIRKHAPLGEPPADPTNKYADDPKAAVLGQKFFFEKAYAGPLLVGDDGRNGGLGRVGETGKVSCASCHEGPWMIDLRSKPGHISLGTGWIPRNSTSIINSAFYAPWVENDGIRDSSWSDNIIDLEFNLGFNSSRLRLAHVIYDKYRDEYNAVFDPDLPPQLDPAHAEAARFPADGRPGSAAWDNMRAEDQQAVNRAIVNFGKALQAYFRKLVSRNAPFDRFVAGDDSAINASAKRGLKLFIGKAACSECHEGAAFTDNEFHNLGMKFEGEHVTAEFEQGRYGGLQALLTNEFRADSEYSDAPAVGAERLKGLPATQNGNTWVVNESERAKWRTKSLRNVAETAPYMHNGQLKTLEDVVKFYNDGGHASGFIGTKDEDMKPLNLTDQEAKDLVEFLKTLTGEVVPEELRRNTAKP
jgi:cytochrome c peroxidase